MTFKRLGSFKWFSVLLALVLVALSISSPMAIKAVTIDPKDDALERGAAWIVARQLVSGGWTESRDPGTTSLALSALTAHAKHLGLSPLDPEYEYSENIQDALDYIFSRSQRDTVNNFVHWGSNQIYVLGPALMAITSVETPETVIDLEGSAVDGMTHFEVVEEVVNYIAESQVKSGPGIGLWYYSHPTSTGDMSISGWVTLGLSYAKEKFGLELPLTMLNYLDQGLDIVIWDDNPEHELYGGAGYTSSSTIANSYRSWINIHKVGHMLSMLELVGDPIDSPRVQAALGFIERHFNAPNSGTWGTSSEWPSYANGYIDVGWRGKPGVTNPSYNGALTIMKGLLAYGIDTIEVDEVETDWQDEFEDVIVGNQHVDGYWQSGGYPDSTSETYRIYYTAWAMMTLLRSVPSIAVTGVSLTCPEKALVVDSRPYLLTPTIAPNDASNPAVTWLSSHPAVATVVDGSVAPLQAGTTTITVTTVDGEFTSQCLITVKEPHEFVQEIVDDKTTFNVDATNLNKAVIFDDDELEEGASVKLVIEVLELADVDLTEKTLIEAYLKEKIGDDHEVFYLDISLFKLVGQNEFKLTSSLEYITISFIVDESLRDVDFKFFRVHNGVVEALEYVYDDETFEITFGTDKFSTYAFGYDAQDLPDTSDHSSAGIWLLLCGLAFTFFRWNKKTSV